MKITSRVAPICLSLTLVLPLATACEPVAVREKPVDGDSEEKVIFVTSGSLDIYTKIFERFTQKYGIPAEVNRKPPEIIAEMVASEAESSNTTIDLIDMPAATLTSLHRDGYIADFMPEEAETYPDSFKYGGWGVAVRQVHCSTIYNTDLVTDTDLQSLESFKDLANPGWKNRIVMEFPERGAGTGFTFFHTMLELGEIDQNFLKALHGNNPLFGRSATPIITMLAAGDAAAYLNGKIDVVEQFKTQGAPVDWLRQNVIFSIRVPVAITADAPHPESAKLAYGYLLTEEAQQLVAELGEGPTHPSVRVKWWPPGYDPRIIFDIPPTPEKKDEFRQMLIDIFNR
jgi:iron(III) transport system substrate-binding protein